MKNPFSKYNSKLLLFLLLFIGLLSVRSGKYTYIVNILFFVSLFVCYCPVLSNIFLMYFSITVFLTMLGIILGNDYISISEDFITFSPLILLFFHNRYINNDLISRLPIYLANSLLFMLPISLVIFLYMDYSPGSMMTTRFSYDTSTKLALFAPILPLLYAPYLIFFLHKLNRTQKLLVHSSVIIISLFGIMTLSKSVATTGLGVYLIYYGYRYLIQNVRPFLFLKLLLILFLVLFGVYLTGTLKILGLEDSFIGIIERTEMQGMQGESTRFSSGRIEETEDYLAQDLDFIEYLFGRGLGGHKVRIDSDPYIGGVNMMHIGPAHVFLKGGILLLFILYVPALLAIWSFLKTPDYHLSLILIYFLIGNIQTSSWSWGITLFFYWYGIWLYFKKPLTRSVVEIGGLGHTFNKPTS